MNPKSETVSLFQGLLEGEEGRLGIAHFYTAIAPSRENRENLSRYVFMMIFSPYGFESRWAHQLLPTNNVGVVANQRSQQSIGPHRPTQPFRKRFLPFSYRLLSHLFGILFQRWQFRFQLCPGTDFAQCFNPYEHDG